MHMAASLAALSSLCMSSIARRAPPNLQINKPTERQNNSFCRLSLFFMFSIDLYIRPLEAGCLQARNPRRASEGRQAAEELAGALEPLSRWGRARGAWLICVGPVHLSLHTHTHTQYVVVNNMYVYVYVYVYMYIYIYIYMYVYKSCPIESPYRSWPYY